MNHLHKGIKANLAFVICTEVGDLEEKSLLLAKSVREFGGVFSECPIYSFQPRTGEKLASSTLREFDTLSVEHIDKTLNLDFPEYPLANKPIVCSYAERNLDYEYLVFLDSDKVLLAPPSDLFSLESFDVALRPVDGKNIGSCGTVDKNHPYWESLFNLLGVTNYCYVDTTVTNLRIIGYWNSGMVAVRRSKGVFSAWADNFSRVMTMGIQPADGIFFTEQSVLAATLHQLVAKIKELPFGYNYPIHMHLDVAEKIRPKSLEGITSIHYHTIFKNFGARTILEKLFGTDEVDECDKLSWLLDTQNFSDKQT